MKIVVIGDGKVGRKVVKQLSDEHFDVILIDQNEQKIRDSLNAMDIACVAGNGASAEVLMQAGVDEADLVIACASTDELNMLCCLLAKRLGAKQTIARVRSPLYYKQMDLIKDDLKLSMSVNPDLTLAEEIARILFFPSAAKVETFAKGRVELVEITLAKDSRLDNMSLIDLYKKYQIRLLICAVQRGHEVFIPDGSFVLKAGDKIHITASRNEIENFMRIMGMMKSGKAHNVMIVGGGLTAYYLANRLIPMGMKVKIIERNAERCKELCEMLPKATIINGNGSDQSLLEEEGIDEADAFVSLTGADEENIIMAMYANSSYNVPKVIAKVNESALREMAQSMGLDSVVSAKESTVDVILGYVRAMFNSGDHANIETVYRLLEGKVETLEFHISAKAGYTGIPLKELHVKENCLIASIVRDRQIIVPGGNDTIEVGDKVIVVCKGRMRMDLSEIIK